MKRPFLNFLVNDLETLFYNHKNDVEVIKNIYRELRFYRKTKISKKLLKIVEEEITSTKDGKKWLIKESDKQITNEAIGYKSNTRNENKINYSIRFI